MASEGVPPEPWKTSLRVVGRENDPAGGIKVRTANRAFVRVSNVGGSDSRKMRIAIVSPSGQDLRIVSARLKMLLS